MSKRFTDSRSMLHMPRNLCRIMQKARDIKYGTAMDSLDMLRLSLQSSLPLKQSMQFMMFHFWAFEQHP